MYLNSKHRIIQIIEHKVKLLQSQRVLLNPGLFMLHITDTMVLHRTVWSAHVEISSSEVRMWYDLPPHICTDDHGTAYLYLPSVVETTLEIKLTNWVHNMVIIHWEQIELTF